MFASSGMMLASTDLGRINQVMEAPTLEDVYKRQLYPLLDYGRKCTDTEPAKLAKPASAVKASFAGAGVQRAASPLRCV